MSLGRTIGVLAAFSFAQSLVATSASGQVALPSRVRLEAPVGPARLFEVASRGEDGTIRLLLRKRSPDLPPLPPLALTEGYYVMILDPDDRPAPDLVRAQVTDVGLDGVVTLSVGIRALEIVKLGRTCQLVRPYYSTTAQIRTLPDVLPYVIDAGSAARIAQVQRMTDSIENLKRIGLALHAFHAANNAFPPAALYGPDGKPWHSWRVLLLPYLDQTKLYNAYDFSQPWDSEKNRKLLDSMPDVYHDPIYGEDKGQFTNYAMLIGDWRGRMRDAKTAFQPSGQRFKVVDGRMNSLTVGATSLADLTDGTSNTIAVVPVSPDRAIPWTKPDDLVIDEKLPTVGRPGGIAAPYPLDAKTHAAPVLFADGSVRVLLDTIRPDVIQKLATRSSGEIVTPEVVPSLVLPRQAQGSDQRLLKIELAPGLRAWIE
jgi:hypothetical protein